MEPEGITTPMQKRFLVATSLVLIVAVVGGGANSMASANQPGLRGLSDSSQEISTNIFTVFLGDKDGPECKLILGATAADVCGTLIPRTTSTQYRHSNRTPLGSCNMFGWCIKVQHRFAFSWQTEEKERKQLAVFLRNNKRAEEFNSAVAEWLDVMADDMCERPNPIPGCR